MYRIAGYFHEVLIFATQQKRYNFAIIFYQYKLYGRNPWNAKNKKTCENYISEYL